MKRNHLTQTLLITILCVGLAACSDSTSNGNPKNIIQVNSQMDATELANAAEQLVAPHTFMLAYKTAQMALEKDPTNLKAQFYVKLLKRFEAFRGMGVRLKPKKAAEQKKINDYMAKFPKSPARDFLTDTTQTTVSEVSDVQNVLSQYYGALIEFRKFLKDNETQELEININPALFQGRIQQDQADSCLVTETSPGNFQVECDYTNVLTRKLNMADMIALRQFTAQELLSSLMNSYSLTGIDKLQDIDPQHKMTDSQRTNFLLNQADFGKLRKDETFSLLRSLGADFGVALKWVQDNQAEVCPLGSGYIGKQRKGYLFEGSGCIAPQEMSNVDRTLVTLNNALSGIIRQEFENNGGVKKVANVNIFALSDSPIKDLRQIAPTSWSACGRVASIKDATLGGMFVDGDVNSIIDSSCK